MQEKSVRKTLVSIIILMILFSGLTSVSGEYQIEIIPKFNNSRITNSFDIESWDIIVPDDNSTIQEAVDYAGPENGYRIFVKSGTYIENVIIETDGIVLHGEDKTFTIIDGNKNGDVIKIDCNYLDISRFTIKNSSNSGSGINVFQSSGCHIHNNIIKDNNIGINIFNHSHANNITKNHLMDNQNGIIIVGFCTGNTIIANTISENCYYGIGISNVSRNNVLISNMINNNLVGMSVSNVSDGNYFYANSLISNDFNAYDNSINNWDNGEIGNYWSDYIGLDNNNDGIGDTSYNIEGGNNKDNYPLMDQPSQFRYYNIIVLKNDLNKIQSTISNFTYNGRTIIVPDDYPTIQDAVNHSNDGDIVYVREGVYYEHVTVNKQLRIEGEGADYTFVDGMGENNHVFTIDAKNVEITGFTIRNCSVGFSGVRVYSDNCYIHNNTIFGCGGGVELWLIKNAEITNNIYLNNIWGIYIHKSDICLIKDNILSSNIYGVELGFSTVDISNCTIKDNKLQGILHFSSDNVAFTGNSLSSNGDIGLQMFSSTNNTINMNSINYNEDDGISIQSSHDNVINDNNIGFNNYDGLSLRSSTINSIYDNNINNNFWSGIWLESSSYNLISKNDINKNNDGILLVSSSENNQIIGNDIYSKHTTGISLISSSDNSIAENNITDNNFGIRLKSINTFSLSDNNYIFDNTINMNLHGIMLITSSDNSIFHNDIKDNGYGIYLIYSANNNSINKNNINNNSFGIRSEYSSFNSITGSNINNNMMKGIELYFSSNNNYVAGNNVSHNTRDGIILSDSSINIIRGNNFIGNDLRNAYFFNSYLNRWSNNYWDDWIKINPNPIYGRIVTSLFDIIWVNFDWNPTREPYDIPELA